MHSKSSTLVPLPSETYRGLFLLLPVIFCELVLFLNIIIVFKLKFNGYKRFQHLSLRRAFSLLVKAGDNLGFLFLALAAGRKTIQRCPSLRGSGGLLSSIPSYECLFKAWSGSPILCLVALLTGTNQHFTSSYL